MSDDEKRTLLSTLYESSGKSFTDAVGPDVQVLSPPLPETRSIRQYSGDVPHFPNTSLSAGLNIANFRRIASFNETCQAENVNNYNELQVLWRSLVEELAIYGATDRVGYSQQIAAAVRELGPESPYGVTIALLLPHGSRITRVFAPESPTSAVYIWCASDDRMVKEMAKPGTFVIVRANGIALRPQETVGSLFAEPHVLLNVRFIG
jgi:hypothetical protein